MSNSGPPSDKTPSFIWTTILPARLLINAQFRIPYPFLPAISRGLGVPLEVASLLLAVRGLLGATSPVFGYLSDRIGRYTTPLIEHAYLQPGAGLAAVDAGGRLTLWTATQWPDEDRRQIAYALGPHPAPADLPVVAQATYHAPQTYPMDPETGQSPRANPTYGYGCQVVEVSVDAGTGEVRLLQAITASDVGQTINQIGVEGQAEGGLVMGQGYSLLEEYVLERGRPQTTTLATFLIPTALDVPEQIDALIVEAPDADGPYGAKGVGEMTMLATPGAIAAAIHAATGKWVDDLPITPERVLRALGKL